MVRWVFAPLDCAMLIPVLGCRAVLTAVLVGVYSSDASQTTPEEKSLITTEAEAMLDTSSNASAVADACMQTQRPIHLNAAH
jgi:hypothetical protein